jgi:hypothetical protein
VLEWFSSTSSQPCTQKQGFILIRVKDYHLTTILRRKGYNHACEFKTEPKGGWICVNMQCNTAFDIEGHSLAAFGNQSQTSKIR